MNNIQKSFSGKLKKRNGFTLIEMLIVVAIIAILVVVSIPLVTTSMDKAEQATDDANIRAAKATAVMEYLGNDKDLSTAHYYDVEKGTLVTAKPDGYNQSDLSDVLASGTKADKNSYVIEVTVTETATAGEPNINCTWTKATA